MEYRRAYWDEKKPNEYLIGEHYRRIFPLLKKRYLFSGVEYFQLFDLYRDGEVQHSAFCYVNGTEHERVLVLYNNQYEVVEGWIKSSAPKVKKSNGDKHFEEVSLAEALNLTVGGRRYVITDSFSDGLTYMKPSLKVFDEGFFVHLRGFETKVYLNIREVEDSDGIYSALYEQMGDSGIANFEQEILALRLKPVYKAMDHFLSPSFYKQIKRLMGGKATSKTERTLILLLAEAYTHLSAVVENLHPEARKSLPSLPREISPSSMLEEIQRMSSLFNKEESRLFFLQGTLILDEMESVMAAALFLKPFLSEDATISDAMVASDKLLLSRFFKEQLCDAGFEQELARKACHSAAILAASANMIDDSEDDPKQILATLLKDPSLRAYAQVNEHQGVTWYTKEAMQEIIYLSALSLSIHKGMSNAQKYVKTLMDAETEALYKLDRLLG